MGGGFVKTYRSVLQNPFCACNGGADGNAMERLGFWQWCLLQACYEPRQVYVGGELVTLQPGEFLGGRNYIMKQTGLTQYKVRRYINALQNLHQIATSKKPKYTVYKLLNWDAYQQNRQQTNQHFNQQNASKPTSKTPANQPLSKKETIERKKESKKDTDVPAKPARLPYGEDFEKFWQLYPNSPDYGKKGSKKEAYAKWRQVVKKTPPAALCAAIEAQMAHHAAQLRQGNSPQYFPHAVRWLRHNRWEDEMPTAQPKKATRKPSREEKERAAAAKVKRKTLAEMTEAERVAHAEKMFRVDKRALGTAEAMRRRDLRRRGIVPSRPQKKQLPRGTAGGAGFSSLADILGK